MKHLYARRLAVLALLILPASPAFAQSGRFDLQKTKTVLTGLVEKTLRDNGIPSMSIALVRGDSVVWTAAFGYANMRTRTPATTQTIYSTGSSFKSVTATAVMQLAEQGKLKVDEPINTYLGDAQVKDSSAKPVTFAHILSHWSGLRNGAETQPIWGRRLPKTLEGFTTTLTWVRAPETKWEYNNFAYGTAGLLVQKISGVEYEKYIVDNILTPLGVTTPHPVYPSPAMVERMALPYNAGGTFGKPAPVAQMHFDVYPAGDIYLTAEDMARYLIAQLNGGVFHGNRILSEASVREMQKERFGGDYGFGFWTVHDTASGHTLIHHGGAIAGQRAFLIGDLDAKVGVYYMTNSDFLPDATPPVQSEIVYAALKLLRGENYTPRPEKKSIAVDEKLLNSYVGTYDAGRATITVRRVGRALAFQQYGQSTITELVPVNATRFLLRGSNMAVTFEGDVGSIERLVVEAGGQRQVATRRKLAQPPAKGFEGSWQGTLEAGGAKLRMLLKVTRSEAGAYAAELVSLDQGSASIPVDPITVTADSVRLEMKPAGALFAGVLNKERTELVGRFAQGGQEFPLTFTRGEQAAAPKADAPKASAPLKPKLDYSAPADAPYTAEDVIVKTAAGHTLAGTLTLPKRASRATPVGAIVTISGSGAQDRDENLGLPGHRPFRQIADSLARRGIAVLRMDDRGTGASGGTFKGATSADFAEDVRAGLAYLRTRPEIRSDRLAVLGHSEGAVIAPMVADKEPTLRALVLLAGVADPARSALHAQIRNLYDHDTKLTPAQRDSLIVDIPKRIDGMMAADPWMHFFLSYDPAATMRRVKTPVLILTGSRDQQAAPAQVPLMEAAFKAAGNTDVTARVLPDLNHLFVHDTDGFPGNYAKLPPPIVIQADVVGMIADWLAQRLR